MDRSVRIRHDVGTSLRLLDGRDRIGATLIGNFRLDLDRPRRTFLTLPTARTLGAFAVLTAGVALAIGALAPVLTLRALLTVRAVRAALTVGAFWAIRAFEPFLAIGALLALYTKPFALLADADRLALVAELVIAVDIEIGLLTAWLLLLEPAALVAQHAEIMIGELEVIFGVDAIALALRVRGQVLVLFVQLVGVAAGAAVDPIAIVGTPLPTGPLTTITVAATTTTAATTTGLPIVDQAACP